MREEPLTMTKAKPTADRPPKHLAEPEAHVWTRLRAEYGLGDAPALLLLEVLCDALAVVRRARELIDREGVSVDGKPHVLCKVMNDGQKTVLASLKALQLDMEPLRDGPGRPPGV
jgi:hypothetical protein